VQLWSYSVETSGTPQLAFLLRCYTATYTRFRDPGTVTAVLTCSIRSIRQPHSVGRSVSLLFEVLFYINSDLIFLAHNSPPPKFSRLTRRRSNDAYSCHAPLPLPRALFLRQIINYVQGTTLSLRHFRLLNEQYAIQHGRPHHKPNLSSPC
jgi:hypothetical protein